ncbi:21015_t:CDS:2 [Rhizophagus irregularis]|nr:21015_t:CDS:2 [Rhizophagus irregularis]
MHKYMNIYEKYMGIFSKGNYYPIKEVDNNQRGISFIGSIALLVSAMTGPGLVTIPLLFQMSGWLIPTIMFIIAMSLSAISSLLLCEALTTIRGNEYFQRKIEFTHLTNFLIPQKKTRIIIQIILYLSIESVIIASIILSAQSMDLMLLKWAGKTCGLGFHPNLGFFCINDAIDESSPFGSNYMMASLGFMITLGFCAPLAFLDLVDNIVVVGTVLFNYAFVTTVPSWVNDLRPDVSIRKATWYSVMITTSAYILLGILGGMTYKMDLASNIIAEIDNSSHRNILTDIATFLFPLAGLLTSIPVYSIVVRYNLERSGLCKRGMAILLSTFLPWIIVLPFQSGFWLNIFTNWTSLLFTSANINNIIEKATNIISGTSSSTGGDNLLHPNRTLHHRYNRSSENINDNLIITTSTTPTTPTTPISPISPISPMLPTSPLPISPTTSSSSTIKPEPFTAFPTDRKCRMMVSKIAGIIAIILVGGIIIYDLIKLALGSNE